MITVGNCKRYDELVKLIKTKGVMGVKGYFNASIANQDGGSANANGDGNGVDRELRVYINELLPQQPW